MAKKPTEADAEPQEDIVPPATVDQSYEDDAPPAETVDSEAEDGRGEEERAPAVPRVHQARRGVYDRLKAQATEEAEDGERSTVEPEAGADDGEGDAADDAPEADPPPSPERKFKLKVNRQEREVSEEELIAAAQQHLAAEDELDTVKRLKRELDQALADLRNIRDNTSQRTPANPQEAQPDQTPTRASEADQDDRLREIVNGLQIGDVDEGVKALKSLIDDVKRGHPAMSADEIARQAAAEMRREMVAEAANAEFQRKHPEVYQDRRLAAATVITLNDLCIQEMREIGVSEEDLRKVQQTPELIPEWHRQYRERGFPVSAAMELADKAAQQAIGDLRRALVPEPAPAAEPTPPAAPAGQRRTEARTAEKRAEQTNNPRRASAVARPAPQAPKTTTDVVAEMRAARRFRG